MALNDLRESVSIYLSHAWGLFFRLGFYNHRNWILGDKPRTLSRWPLFDAILILSIPSCHLKKKKKEDHLFRDTFIFFSPYFYSFICSIYSNLYEDWNKKKEIISGDGYVSYFEIKQKLFYTLVWQMSRVQLLDRMHTSHSSRYWTKKKKESVRDKWEQSGMPSI